MPLTKWALTSFAIMSFLLIGALLVLWLCAIRVCEEVWNEPVNTYKPRYRPEPDYRERKKIVTNIMDWQLYKSDRFIVKGGIMCKVIITDFKEQVVYEIAYSDMIKFRKYWTNLSYKKRDSFLLAFVTNRTGKTIKKEAA